MDDFRAENQLARETRRSVGPVQVRVGKVVNLTLK